MVVSFLYILFALVALSLLIFVHELGHYWVARRVGMRVETFSIGFGKPIYSWERDGVKWQIGWLFFGGYVKIAGQEMDDDKDPYEISDGFFGKGPWDRIKVAFAGPFMNLLFALLFFTGLWAMGGRAKNFSEFTPKIGWIDSKSDLYAQGVRPGDEIISYGDHPFQGFKDHIFAPTTASDDKMVVKVNQIDYRTGQKTLKELDVKVYPHPDVVDEGIKTTGVTQSASYLLYDKLPGQKDNPLPEGSPMLDSGIQLGDRIVWVDGHTVDSLKQLNYLLNDGRVLVTLSRGGKNLLRRVPRVHVLELRLDQDYKEELTDWQYEGKLQKVKLRELFAIPYRLNNQNVVEGRVAFVDREGEREAFPAIPYSSLEDPLEPGDRILAVDGHPVHHPFQLIDQIQKPQAIVIVERKGESSELISLKKADEEFDREVNWADLDKIANSLGTEKTISHLDRLYLLKTVTPKKRGDFFLSPEAQALRDNDIVAKRKMIEEIDDPEKRAHALNLLENQENQLVLGVSIQDLKIKYNPSPIELFENVLQEIGRTLTALFTGTLNPKWMSGPVGIIQMVHDYSMVSIKESLYWMGLISLNLGILNLLPIPVLDGGTILFSLFELITRKRIQPKTMEKFIIPFAMLLIGFFIFLTYNDVMRIAAQFWLS